MDSRQNERERKESYGNGSVCKSESELEEIVAANTGLVKSVALRLSFIYKEELEDLIQIGYIGLLKAAERFEADRGNKFSTYAVTVIAGEIKSQLRDQGKIKVSRGLKTDSMAVRKAESGFTAKHGRSPKITELATETGLSPERVVEALQAYDAMKNFEDYEKTDLWTDDEERNITKIDLKTVLDALEPREKQVIMLRYYKDMTQQQVAAVMGISQVQVCRIEKKTLKAMALDMTP